MNSRFIEVKFTTDDILGSKLGEPINKHTIVELRWWLLCPGIKAPTSWKKVQLITREFVNAVLLKLH